MRLEPVGDEDPGPQTNREPYPRLLSTEQDEMIYHLRKQYELLERRVKVLEESRVPE